jgi:glutaredoxin
VSSVVVYSRADCHLCEQALAGLRTLREQLSFELREVDISSDESLHRTYFDRIPVVAVDGEELCEHFLDEARVRERLESGR